MDGMIDCGRAFEQYLIAGKRYPFANMVNAMREIHRGSHRPYIWWSWERYRYVANFDNATLIDAGFEDTSVAGASFRNANLAGARFYGSDISRADFTGALGLSDAKFEGAYYGHEGDDRLTSEPINLPEPITQNLKRC